MVVELSFIILIIPLKRSGFHFQTPQGQDLTVEHEISDGNLPQAGQGLIIKSTSNPSHPAHIQIDGEFYSNSNKVWHAGNFNPNTKINANGSNWTPHSSNTRTSAYNYFYTNYGYIQFGPANTSWAHVYTDRPNFYFNKNIYILGKAVVKTDDSRLSDSRTPNNSSVSYAKVANDLINRITDNDSTWDFNAAGIIDTAVSSNRTITLSNVKQNKTLKVKVVITNSASITLPSSCTILDGSADMSGNNGTYYVYLDAWSTSEILVTIAKAA